MQAVSVKVGERYGPEYVNQLYKQLLSFDKNVVYYCMTDNAEGLNKNIEILPVKDEFGDRKWWTKIELFKPGLFEEATLYFDLDCFIHLDPNVFLQKAPRDKLGVLKTYWFSNDIATKMHQCTINTSVMKINAYNSEPLWKDCQDNMEKIYKSFYGLDPWIYRRHLKNVFFYPAGHAYSYKHGCMFPNDIDSNKLRMLPVCILDDVHNRDEVLDELWQSK